MPRRRRTLALRWPSGGLDRKFAYRQQRPYTTPDCLNVRPKETLEGRERGGSRPGVGKSHYDLLGGGSEVNMLAEMETIVADSLDLWADNFQGQEVGSVWESVETHPWVVSRPSIPKLHTMASNGLDAAGAGDAEGGAVREALPAFKATSVYELALFLVPFQGRWHGRHRLYFRMADATPNATLDGVTAELVLEDDIGVFSGSLVTRVAGVPTTVAFTGGTLDGVKAGWFRVLVTGDNVKCFWHEKALADSAVSAAAGKRFGFGLKMTTVGRPGRCYVDTFRIQYTRDDTREVPRRKLVAASAGSLYVEPRSGKLDLVTTTLTLAADRNLQAADRVQRLYIADNGNPKASGTDGTVAGDGVTFDAASVPDWTTKGISLVDDVITLTNATGSVVAGVYKIAAVAAGSLTLASSTGGSGGAHFRIERGPKVFDPKAGTLSLLMAAAGKGAVPVGNRAIATYRDRLILAGADAAPHVWFMSRQGDPEDWDYGADPEDVGRAVAGTSAEAGQIGEPILALIPHADDSLIFACEHSLWLLRGDPAYGGQIDSLSHSIGVVGQGAWCRTSGGQVILMSRDGLYGLEGQGGAFPASLSREKIPEELRDVDPRLYTVLLAWDIRDRGVHIYLTPTDRRKVLHWWFDWESKSYWPLDLAGDHEPLSLLALRGAWSEDTCVLLGCRDGFVRRYHDAFESDDGLEIASHVVLGPFRPGGDDYHAGIVPELWASLPDSQGRGAGGPVVTWQLFVADDEEGAAALGRKLGEGDWEAGLSFKERPRSRASAFVLRVGNHQRKLLKEDGGEILLEDGSGSLLLEGQMRRWALDKVVVVVAESGAERRL